MLIGLLGAASFLLAAFVVLLTGIAGPGRWAPLHLALAGGAGLAVGALLPHFTVSLAVARPAPARWRFAGLALLAIGAATAVAGVTALGSRLAAAGAAAFVLGIGVTAATAFLPTHGALGRRAGVIEIAYGLALTEVGASVSLAMLYLAGLPGIVAAWPWLKPAHAWLNLVGFVGLVIAATLIHLYPTAVGGRIHPRPILGWMVGGLAVGASTVALGYAVRNDWLARAGALAAIIGAGALVRMILDDRHPRGRWTTDLAWHRLVIGHLSAGAGWLAVGVTIASAAVLVGGADPAGWSVDRLIGPLVIGCIVQVLVGAWSHLIPAVGPGDVARHSLQRDTLGRWPVSRLVLINAGALLATVGPLMDDGPLAMVGVVAATGAVAVALGLLAVAVLRR